MPKEKSKITHPITFQDWKNLFNATFVAFPDVWWRVAVISISALLIMFFGIIILGLIAFFSFGGFEGIQNIYANFMMGGSLDIPVMFGLGALVLILAIWLIVFSIAGKIGNFLIVKGYINKHLGNPFKIFFRETWHYFWRYVWLGIRVVWYVAWPVLLVMLFSGLIGAFLNGEAGGVGQTILDIVVTIAFVGVFLLAIMRGVQCFFAQATLVHFDKSTIKTFPSAINLVVGNWWRVCFSLLGFFVLVSIVRFFFFIPEILMSYNIVDTSETVADIFAFIDFCFSFFILAPLLITFVYMLMVHLAKTKKITP